MRHGGAVCNLERVAILASHFVFCRSLAPPPSLLSRVLCHIEISIQSGGWACHRPMRQTVRTGVGEQCMATLVCAGEEGRNPRADSQFVVMYPSRIWMLQCTGRSKISTIVGVCGCVAHFCGCTSSHSYRKCMCCCPCDLDFSSSRADDWRPGG